MVVQHTAIEGRLVQEERAKLGREFLRGPYLRACATFEASVS